MKVKYHIDRMKNPVERERAEQNVQRMAAFASALVCRRIQLLEYFGEKQTTHCGNCDVCKGDVVRTEATVDAQKILSAIARTGERFGVVHIIDVVTGADTEKIRRHHHNTLPTWGVGRDRNKTWWRAVVDELLAQKYLSRDEDRYNALTATARGRELLKGGEAFYLARVEEKKTAETRRSGSASGIKARTPAGSVDGFDERLYPVLRDLRNKVAAKKGVPAYIIFPDKTLREMSLLKPRTLEEMREVSGVGEKKLALYGKMFLELIKSVDD